jgi:hypothetical protein
MLISDHGGALLPLLYWFSTTGRLHRLLFIYTPFDCSSEDARKMKTAFNVAVKVERKSDTELYIEKDVIPSFYFDITLDVLSKSIKIHCDRREWIDQDFKRSDQRLHLGLDENDEPYVAKNGDKLTPDQVSHYILNQIIKG